MIYLLAIPHNWQEVTYTVLGNRSYPSVEYNQPD